MYRISLILILSFLSISSTITVKEINTCIKSNCTKEYSACSDEIRCNSALQCYNNCSRDDFLCRNPCNKLVNSSQTYWIYELCAISCLQNLVSANYSNDINNCTTVNCSLELSACMNNSSCLETINCLSECDEVVVNGTNNNFNCSAQCIVSAFNNTNNPSFFPLAQCELECMFTFVNSSQKLDSKKNWNEL